MFSPNFKFLLILSISTNIFLLFKMLMPACSKKFNNKTDHVIASYLEKDFSKKFQTNESNIKLLGKIPKIKLQISEEVLTKMKLEVKDAINHGVITDTQFYQSKFNSSHEVREIKSKIRLKGDWADHLIGKWSFRIELKGDHTFWGMKSFSLQHPKTRRYLNEWFYHQIMRDEGIMSLRYDLVELFINNKSKGIYAIEEAWDKRLIEFNQRRESIILKVNEDGIWNSTYLAKKYDLNSPVPLKAEPYSIPELGNIEAFSQNSIGKMKSLDPNSFMLDQVYKMLF